MCILMCTCRQDFPAPTTHITKQPLLIALRRGQATEEQLNHVWEELKYFYWGDRESNFNFTSIHEARRLRQEQQQQLHKHSHPHVHKQHHVQRSPRKGTHESSVKQDCNEGPGSQEQSSDVAVEADVLAESDQDNLNKEDGKHNTSPEVTRSYLGSMS
jgi:hypothetical protein